MCYPSMSVMVLYESKALILYFAGNRSIRSKATSLASVDQKYEYRHYTATLFTKLTEPLDIPFLLASKFRELIPIFREKTQDGIDMANMLHTPEQARSMSRSSFKSQDIDKSRRRLKRLWILVCTHRARDCRCGEHGSAVAQKIRDYIRQKNLIDQVICGEVSHVGGHKCVLFQSGSRPRPGSWAIADTRPMCLCTLMAIGTALYGLSTSNHSWTRYWVSRTGSRSQDRRVLYGEGAGLTTLENQRGPMRI